MVIKTSPVINYCFDDKVIKIIDFIRVFSALGVLLVHVSQITYIPFIHEIATYGAIGVKCFFILSGILVTHSYLTAGSIKSFWKKRLARTLPLYYFWLFVIFILDTDFIMLDKFSIVRSLLMLNYIAPPTVSYDYCSMYLTGVMTIFMVFYAVLPIWIKLVKNLDSAFVGFWVVIFLCNMASKLYAVCYGGFCDMSIVNRMSQYFLSAFPYFAAGIMIYYALFSGEKQKLMAYLIFTVLANSYFCFLHYYETTIVCLFVGILVCYPFKINDNISGLLKILNRYTMGVFITQSLCFKAVGYLYAKYNFNNNIYVLSLIGLPIICAVITYHMVEVPGKKLIYKLMAD